MRGLGAPAGVIDDEIRSIPDVRSVESFTYFGIHTHRFVWGTR